MPTRRLAAPLLALALALTGCGGGADTAGPGSSSHGAGHSTDTAAGNDADVAFLTGMKPHHEQAVEMSDLVLAASPPAPVAELARRIQAAQAPEVEEMERMLADLGAAGDGGHSAHGEGHTGMLSDGEMSALRDVTGTEAARLYLQGMIAHHEGAVEAARTELADGAFPPAQALAKRIAEQQAQEIALMQELLAGL